MAGETIDVQDILSPDRVAMEISGKFRTWNSLRNSWMEDKKELRNYIYATDTTTTSNNKLEWANSTTTPKLTQIGDNLHANYFATLFPNSHWMRWEAMDQDSNTCLLYTSDAADE